MDDIKWCICGKIGQQEHHIVFRSQNRNLIQCKMNQISLCASCHDAIHRGTGYKLDKLLKLQLQNNLEILFDKEYLTKEEVNEVLQISEKALNSLFKTIQSKGNKYTREDIIRACMGGKVQLE